MQTKASTKAKKSDRDLCPCGSGISLSSCCGPYIEGSTTPPSAEALMRSRYTAFATRHYAYLQQTVSPDLKDQFLPETLARETRETTWTGLRVQAVRQGTPADDSGEVTYTAHFEQAGKAGTIREQSRFVKQDGVWLYSGGTMLSPTATVHQEPRPGRNAPCPCGSGKKYKKCCGR